MKVLIPLSENTNGGIGTVIINSLKAYKLIGVTPLFYIIGESNLEGEIKKNGYTFTKSEFNSPLISTLLDDPIKALSNFWIVRKLRIEIERFIVSHKIDIIHSHKNNFCMVYGPASKKYNIPIVSTLHAPPNFNFPFNIGLKLVGYFYNKY